jgi:hypothetical protein
MSDSAELTTLLRAFLAQDEHRILVVVANDAEATMLQGSLVAVSDHLRGITLVYGHGVGDDEIAAAVAALPSDGALGVAVCPTTADDPTTWTQHVCSLITRNAPWQPKVRWMVRSFRGDTTLKTELERLEPESVLWTSCTLSHESYEQQLEQEACSVERPTEQRLNALHQLAWMDVPRGQWERAVERFGVLHDAYAERGDAVMQSLCLLGVGAVYRSRGDATKALVWLQRAVAASLPSGASSVLHSALTAAGEVSWETRYFTEAEQYFVQGAQVAGVLRLWVPLCEGLEKAGVVAMALGNTSDAVWYWERCRALATTMHDDPRSETVLARLQQIYDEFGLHNLHRLHMRTPFVGKPS